MGVGRLGTLGVLAHDAGDVGDGTHRLLETRGLLFRAFAQVLVAADDFPRRRRDGVGYLLDLADHVLERRGRAVRVGLDLGKRALVLAFDAGREVTVGERLEHARDVLEADLARFDQPVDAERELAVEVGVAAGAAGGVDTPTEIAAGRRGDHRGDIALERDLGGAVGPLDHKADAMADGVQHRIDGRAEGPAVHLQVRREALRQAVGEARAADELAEAAAFEGLRALGEAARGERT